VRRVGRARCARPQRTSGPGQTEGNRSRQAEFVICEQTIERGFSFLKDPLFLASSVFVKKPQRIAALSLVMVLCLLVYRLAEHRLREQLAATGQTIPSQLKHPTDRPTMRWVFQCFEGIDLLHIRHGPQPALALVLRLEPLHQQVLVLLGPSYEQFYTSTH